MPFVKRVGLMLFVAGPVSQHDELQPPLLVEAGAVIFLWNTHSVNPAARSHIACSSSIEPTP